jgi:hypothetical protein
MGKWNEEIKRNGRTERKSVKEAEGHNGKQKVRTNLRATPE